MTTRILLAPSADLARATLASEDVLLTVEAEYGSFVAEGSLYTAAHHQPLGSKFAGTHVGGVMPSPCNDTNIPEVMDGGVILVSHVDLDTFGGCLRAIGHAELFRSSFQGFWNLAEFIDTRGPHKISQSGAEEREIRVLNAFWAWSKTNVPRFPRDQVTDITSTVRACADALTEILEIGNRELLLAGDAYRADEQALNTRTFSRREGDILVRIAEVNRDFCNHLYVDPSGQPAKAVVGYNRESGSVTISLADPIPNVSCRAILQTLWGPEAGGHDGIAGSPREKNMGVEGLEAAVRALSAALSS
jgi:hypothetical protein